MNTWLLVLVPLAMAPVIFAAGKRVLLVRGLLLLTAVLHFAGVAVLLLCRNSASVGEWLAADTIGLVVLGATSFLFLCVSIHAWFWLPMAREFEGAHGKGLMRENLFCSVLPVFLATMTMVTLACNFGLLWVAVEATTLASAPLICFHRSPGSLEAMWKYLLICSVGIGLALFGTLLLGVAIRQPGGEASGLGFSALMNAGNTFDPVWFKTAFIFCFAGYGLKMGLAPFHTWLPDAHSEAPSMVSVLLSGALVNCAFLGIVRVLNISPAPLRGFCNEYLVAFGLLSLTVAAFFVIRQSDYKRLLAYSSVEHMGLIALLYGLGVGGGSIALLHLFAHSLTKMLLFLVAGNILLAYGTRRVKLVHGMFSRLPRNAVLWLAGMLLICGTPPSPFFVTEFLLVKAAGIWLGGVIMILLIAVFCGMSAAFLKMTMGEDIAVAGRRPADVAAEKLAWLPAALLVLVLAFGCCLTLKLMEVWA